MMRVRIPIKSPKGSLTRKDLTALEHLEIWKTYQNHWCEHKPSATISIKEHEWLDVGSWVWNNFDDISGVSFLPYADHSYQQAPYQEITAKEYKEWQKKTTSNIDWAGDNNSLTIDVDGYDGHEHTILGAGNYNDLTIDQQSTLQKKHISRAYDDLTYRQLPLRLGR